MSVILTFRCWCVWPRRYLAVLNPAIPPPRMMMCSAEVAMPLEANFAAEADEIDRDTSMLPTIQLPPLKHHQKRDGLADNTTIYLSC